MSAGRLDRRFSQGGNHCTARRTGPAPAGVRLSGQGAEVHMCADAPPPAYAGPGDAHSRQEWVWRREDYAALFADAPPDALRLESTPFYLYLPGARRRIAGELPEAPL